MEQPRRQRRPVDPFLRKPLWVILEEDCGSRLADGADDAAGTDDGDAGMIELPRRSANIEDGDGDDDDEDGGEREDGFSFDYRDGDDGVGSGPLPQQQQQQRGRGAHHQLPPRHLTLFDLVSIGVGGTIGSGIFVLNGLIARSYAGPATFLSWMVSGAAALLSGCCYAELSG